MIRIILASHGPFCEGLLTSLQMIAGPQENTFALQLHEGEAPDDYREKLNQLLADDQSGKGTLVLCDLKGGTPYNSVAFASQKHHLALVTGMNMPMIITLATMRSEMSTLSELVDITLQSESIGVEKIELEFKGEKKHGKLSLNKNR